MSPRQDQAGLLHEAALLLALPDAAALSDVLLGGALPPLPRAVAEPARPRHRQEVPAGHDTPPPPSPSPPPSPPPCTLTIALTFTLTFASTFASTFAFTFSSTFALAPHARRRPYLHPQVKIQEVRPPLGTFKSELTEALRLGDEAAASAISQAGFKQSTWWEDNTEGLDVSFDWRR